MSDFDSNPFADPEQDAAFGVSAGSSVKTQESSKKSGC